MITNDLKWFRMIWHDSEWFATILNDLKRFRMIWNDSIWFETILNDLKRLRIIWNYFELFETIPNDLKRFRMIWNDSEWFQMIQNIETIQNYSNRFKIQCWLSYYSLSKHYKQPLTSSTSAKTRKETNDLKWLRMILNDSEWFEMILNDLKWFWMIWNDSVWFESISNDWKLFWIIWHNFEWFETIANDLKWLRIIWNDSKWFETIPNDLKRFRMISNDSKKFETIRNYSNWFKIHVLTFILQPIRTLQAPPLTSSTSAKTRKESTIGETLANFASSLMGGSKHKNVTKEKEQKTEKEVQPRSTKAGENSQCLKIAKKVAFNIASEASYVYIFSGQKLTKNAKKMVNFGEFLKTWSLRSNSVTRQVGFNMTKNGGKCRNWKSQMRHFSWFSKTGEKGFLFFFFVN